MTNYNAIEQCLLTTPYTGGRVLVRNRPVKQLGLEKRDRETAAPKGRSIQQNRGNTLIKSL
jgi:hypothetical protein